MIGVAVAGSACAANAAPGPTTEPTVGDPPPSTTTSSTLPPAPSPPATTSPPAAPWPDARRSHVLLALGDGRLVVYGGQRDTGGVRSYYADTWQWDVRTGTWTEVATATPPLPRAHAAAGYDSRHDVVVAFGGYVGNDSTYGQLLTWHPGAPAWTELDVEGGPTPRAGAVAAYDTQSELIVVFGGAERPLQPELPLSQTWVLDLERGIWERRDPPRSPELMDEGHPTLFELAMVYDEAADRVILLVGGTEAWAYDVDDDRWERRRDPGLAADFAVAAAYDPVLGRTITYGGAPTGGSQETWLYDYDTDTWTRRATETTPGMVGDHAMAHDPATQTTYLFGGGSDLIPLDGDSHVRDQLWAFDGGDWRLVGP